MNWQRLALADELMVQAIVLYEKRFDRVEIDGWTGFVSRNDSSGPEQGFIIEQAHPRRAIPAALTWIATDAEQLLIDRDWFIVGDAELRVIGDDVTIDGPDSVGVHWTVTWPGAGARIEAQRRIAEDLCGCIERRPVEKVWPTMPFGVVASAQEQDLGVFLARWGLPHFEEYDSRRAPSHLFGWFHTLPDTTRVWVWFDRHNRSMFIYADPGDPARIVRMLNLPSPPWQFHDDEPPIADSERSAVGDWAVIRQDESGGVFVVSTGLAEAVARRWVEVYDARGHKQTYWAEERAQTRE